MHTENQWRRGLIFSVALVVLVLVVAVALRVFAQDNTSNTSTDTKDPVAPTFIADATPTPSPTPTDIQCPTEFVQVAVDHSDGKVDPRFSSSMEPILAQNLNAADFKEATNKVMLELAGTNAQTLAIWANGLGLFEDPNTWQPLVDGGIIVDGGCLSPEGQKLYYQYEGAINANGSAVEQTELPPGMTNSGVVNGQYVVADSPGINGDTRAIKITLSDGSVMWIMVRCGNIPWWTPPPSLGKDWSLSVPAPDGVNVQPNDPYEVRPPAPASPAPVIPATETPSSTSQAQGATTPDPVREIPTPATGTTSDGDTGSVNPITDSGSEGANLTDPGLPSGSGWD